MIDPVATTDDAFLGGRLRIRQMRKGHRSGHDAILLAAATAAFRNDRVLDLGAGAGVAGLAVALRVAGIDLTLVDNNSAVIDLASQNAARNAIPATVTLIDIAAKADAFFEAGLQPDAFDRVMMNPPFNDASRHQPSPDGQRRTAHEADDAALDIWLHTARRLLKPGGTLTLIWRAEDLAKVLAALGRGFGGVALLPVHPKPNTAAIRVLVRATKGSKAPLAVLPGIVLSDGAGQPDAGATAILRGDAVLPLAIL